MASYALVTNIPSSYHSKDLRTFFQDMIERDCFECFHFRHRPDVQVKITDDSSKSDTTHNTTYCCMVRVNPKYRSELISKLNGKHWTKEGRIEMKERCRIIAIKVSQQSSHVEQTESGSCLSENDVKNLVEMRPPGLMPQGNVGTPTAHFLHLINECKLPPKVVKNLGLTFPKSSARRIYASVPMDYDKKDEEDIEQSYLDSQMADCDEGSDDDTDACQEWERHEALHEDCGKQGRLGERLYEQEMEVVWEKGGPGLVFYTDSFYWDQMKGTDTDERWADDWDVDMSLYYPSSSTNYREGDKFSQDMQDIRMSEEQETVSVFKKKQTSTFSGMRKRRHSDSDSDCSKKFAHFETHSKGVGRRLMEQSGWTQGQGLGAKRQGKPLPIALESDGQVAGSRKGLGFVGEKLQRFGLRPAPKKHWITTVYDDPAHTDPKSKVDRRNELTHLKHT